jgi:hypothetical protein
MTLEKPHHMTRQEALCHINNLYGLESPYVQAAIDALGPAALSDQAVLWIAYRQRAEERERGRWIERVEAYQHRHPHLGWKACEEHLRAGLL